MTRAVRWFITGTAGLLLLASVSSGQNVTEPSLKAALIYNFARFTEWPDDVLPANAPFIACVLGNTPVGQALDRVAKDRLLAGHPVSVIRMAINGPLRSCHLLYVSDVTNEQVTRIVTGLRGIPVLTIVDIEDLTVADGIARVFVENGKMHFNLDHGLAKRCRLQLSSKLLSLASHVYDEPVPVTR